MFTDLLEEMSFNIHAICIRKQLAQRTLTIVKAWYLGHAPDIWQGETAANMTVPGYKHILIAHAQSTAPPRLEARWVAVFGNRAQFCSR